MEDDDNSLYFYLDAVNTQVTGTSPYELIVGPKPRSVLFKVD